MNPTFVLSHPWARSPMKSFDNAVHWTSQLRQKGLLVFSPILHSHSYWQRLMCDQSLEYIENEDWAGWDLGLMQNMLKGDGKTAYTSFTCENNHRFTIKQPNLDLICPGFLDRSCGKALYPEDHPQKNDSNLVILMSETAIHEDVESIKNEYNQYIKDPNNYGFGDFGWCDLWESDGCRREYEFGKKNFVRILSLEKVLTIINKIQTSKVTLSQILQYAKDDNIDIEL